MTKTFLIAAVVALIAENYYFRYRIYQKVHGFVQGASADWINYQTAILHLMHKSDIRFRDLHTTETSFSKYADAVMDHLKEEATVVEGDGKKAAAEVVEKL